MKTAFCSFVLPLMVFAQAALADAPANYPPYADQQFGKNKFEYFDQYEKFYNYDKFERPCASAKCEKPCVSAKCEPCVSAKCEFGKFYPFEDRYYGYEDGYEDAYGYDYGYPQIYQHPHAIVPQQPCTKSRPCAVPPSGRPSVVAPGYGHGYAYPYPSAYPVCYVTQIAPGFFILKVRGRFAGKGPRPIIAQRIAQLRWQGICP